MEMLEVGDDVFNSAINRMGSFRYYLNDKTVTVRTVSGLENWNIADCIKFESIEE